MNRKRRKIVLSLVVAVWLSACATKLVPPTPEELSAADYGAPPEEQEASKMVRTYLKTSGYYDPNGAEIESCTKPEKTWVRNRDAAIPAKYFFGWKFSCDVNGKNRMGGFVGFKTYEYFARDGKVVSGMVPGAQMVPLFTPGSRFQVWG